MKKLVFFILLSVIAIGCSTEKSCCKTNNSSTNNVSFSAFNDERYVWENWTFSTNKVNNLN